jgi:hypothetical protein
MASKHRNDGVLLPEGHTGSSFFQQLLQTAVEQFPKVFHDVTIPEGKGFKKNYAETLVQFEAARVSSNQRSEIARFIVKQTQEQLMFRGHGFYGKFRDYMAQPTEPAAIETTVMQGQAGLIPSVPFRGQTYTGRTLSSLGQLLLGEEKTTNRTAQALNWMSQYLKEHESGIDLRGQKFVILGASAELAPTTMLLEAGASVLWVDLQAPDQILAQSHKLAGELHVAKEASNILLEPNRIRATIEAFAAGEPVNIGMFAYAAGASQEWRLAATMNGIIHRLDPACVGSVSMLISPTSAAVVQTEDRENSKRHEARPPVWQALLRKLGQLKDSACFEVSGIPIARAIVPLQGLSYQAAQYVSKTLAAEAYATQGITINGQAQPLRVSSNVAGITKTRSLQHPVFQAAFLGAETFGVEIFEVPTTRPLSTTLMLYDLLQPAEDPADRLASLFAKQVHGGIYSRAYALDPMIRIATVMGLAQRPRLLLKMF